MVKAIQVLLLLFIINIMRVQLEYFLSHGILGFKNKNKQKKTKQKKQKNDCPDHVPSMFFCSNNLFYLFYLWIFKPV